MKKEGHAKIDAKKFKSWDEFLKIRCRNTKKSFDIVTEFNDVQSSKKFFEYLKVSLPIITSQLPKIDGSTVVLASHQFYFFQISWMKDKGVFQPEFLGDQYLLKTLRADRYDFSSSFISGIIPGKDGSRYYKLRTNERGEFTLSPEGSVTARLDKKPANTTEEKKGFSQIQSCTYIDDRLLVDAFGFSKAREGKLYGVLTHKNDALFSRLMVTDCGTVVRPFDFASREEADASSVAFFPRSKFRLFVKKNTEILSATAKKWTNEVLARLRFNPYRTLMVVCSDTLEARMLAYHSAQEMLQAFKEYAYRNHLKINPNYRIPIIFYLPANSFGYRPGLTFYSEDMRVRDCAECVRIYQNRKEGDLRLFNNDYEFLLGLPKIPEELFLRQTKKGNLFALEMLMRGYARMLFRLLRSVNNPSDNTVVEEIFEGLLGRGLIKENDFIIGDLVMIEEFDLAEKIIERTSSDKLKLYFREYNEAQNVFDAYPLDDYLLLKGNPKQIQFMGLERMLKKAAELKKWGAIRLCVKEFPSINKILLGELLFVACQQKKYAEVAFLLQRGADTTVQVDQETALEHARSIGDETMEGLIAQYSAEATKAVGHENALGGKCAF